MNIIEKHELVDIWPSKNNAYKCIVLNGDNTKHTIDVPKSECELVMYLKQIKHKLSQNEMLHLVKLIEEFGSEKYDGGSMND